MSNLIDHARAELAAIGIQPQPGKPIIQKMVSEDVLELLEVFSKQGHSGSSAPYIAGLFHKLAMFEPLGPLTGADSEWVEVGEGVFQNARCSHVFKENGQAYDSEGRIFREPDGSCFTNRDSRVPVTFPYTPKREYVDRPAS